MHLPTEIFGEVLVVHAPDELNDEHATAFYRFVTEQGRTRVIVDLDGVESLDSAGLTSLLDAQDWCRAAQGDLKLMTSNAMNLKILEITRLDEQLEAFESVIDAVKSFA